ncbi:unnamed protein product [Timema podura]|uniref:Uncharacterized protein n=1 Tax=Timema podura TaxID=61482 RepID=A0ABN7NVW3_TIMPD|nr:unnamed protein product [Timema podura]
MHVCSGMTLSARVSLGDENKSPIQFKRTIFNLETIRDTPLQECPFLELERRVGYNRSNVGEPVCVWSRLVQGNL